MWEAYINFSLLIVLAAICLKNGLVRTGDVKLIFYYVLVTLIFELAAFIDGSGNNLFYFHLLVVIQGIIQLQFLKKSINSIRSKRVIASLTVTFIFFSILSAIKIQKTHEYNSIVIISKAIIIAVVSFYYFIDLFRSHRSQEIRLVKQGKFWIISGFLIQALGSFYFEGVMNYLIYTDNKLSLTFYFINVSFGFILYIFLLIGLIHCKS